MGKDLERLVALVYKKWKKSHPNTDSSHPNEDVIVSFLEGRLLPRESEALMDHFTKCDDCAEIIALNLSSYDAQEAEIPKSLIDFAKDKFGVKGLSPLEIVLKLKEKTLEIISSTGEILIGQEMLPAAVLRSRNMNEFRDELVILKDFQDISLKVRIENKSGKLFNLNIQVNDKQGQDSDKDFRVTLFKDNVELESYLTESGSVVFEHISAGEYKVELEDLENNVASVLLDVRV